GWFFAEVGDAAQLQHLVGPGPTLLLPHHPPGEPEEVGRQPATPAPPLQGHQQVLLHAQPAERLLALERATDAVAGAPRRRPADDLQAVVVDGSRRGGAHSGQAVEKRRLPCAIRPDEAAYL